MRQKLIDFLSELDNHQLMCSVTYHWLLEDEFLDIGEFSIKNDTLYMWFYSDEHDRPITFDELKEYVGVVNKTPFSRIVAIFDGEYPETEYEVNSFEVDDENNYEDTLGEENHPYLSAVKWNEE